MSDFAPGAVIDGRYRVRSRVGAGGMADVYLAQDEQLGRQVAVKVLHRRFSADPAFVERFKREARSAAVLQHPHVVSVFDRGEFDGTYYIAMEYLPGRSLKALIGEEAPLDSTRAINITIQILQATGFAHQHGVIHRDLKPHNVIVDADDNVKVTDFGIARAGASDMTETGSIMGTAQYLSPEQAQGRAVSGPSDLYSVGVILYEMLTGRVPFDGDSPVAIALKHVSEGPTPPSRINPAILPDLEQVVMWSLNKNPADRPADADQFIEVLEQVKNPAIDHTASMQALSGVAAAAAAAGMAPEAVRLVDNGHGNGGSETSAGQPGQSGGAHGKRRTRLLIFAGVVALVAAVAVAFLLTRPQKLTVPKVDGLTLANAEATLQSAGFSNYQATTQSGSTGDGGTVVWQDPLAGAKVKASTTIHMIVSSGSSLSATVSVPSVVGLSQAQATAALKTSGLTLGHTQSEHSTSVAKGQATRTDPAAGQIVARNDTVTLWISSGPPPTKTTTTSDLVRVPNLVNDNLASAQTTLNNLFLNYIITPQTTSSATPNTVLSQSVQAGTKVAQGTTITLVVAQAVTTVPAVVGINVTQAINTLRAAGYDRVSLTYTNVSSSSQNQIVQKQTPTQNAAAAVTTVVSLVVGQYVTVGTETTTNTDASASGQTTTDRSSLAHQVRGVAMMSPLTALIQP